MTFYRESGLVYCVVHHGIVDVDRDQCDFGRWPAGPEDQADCALRPLV